MAWLAMVLCSSTAPHPPTRAITRLTALILYWQRGVLNQIKMMQVVIDTLQQGIMMGGGIV